MAKLFPSLFTFQESPDLSVAQSRLSHIIHTEYRI